MNITTKIILLSLLFGFAPHCAPETVEQFIESISTMRGKEILRILNHLILAQLNPTQHVRDCGVCIHQDTNTPYTNEDLAPRIAALKKLLNPQSRSTY